MTKRFSYRLTYRDTICNGETITCKHNFTEASDEAAVRLAKRFGRRREIMSLEAVRLVRGQRLKKPRV